MESPLIEKPPQQSGIKHWKSTSHKPVKGFINANILNRKNFSFLYAIFVATIAFITAAKAADMDKEVQDLDFAQVVHVKAVEGNNDTWCFHTTVRHNDQGWDHYADAWQVLDDQDNEIGLRVLQHPHDNEQPFTRSECGITIPITAKTIRVRAKCNVHGYADNEVVLDLSTNEGEQYSISRKN